jgi:hypothetical protein
MIVDATLPVAVDLGSLVTEQSVSSQHLALAREAELRMRRLRLQIKVLLSNAGNRRCYCGTQIEGRSDKVYCSATCRENARANRTRELRRLRQDPA